MTTIQFYTLLLLLPLAIACNQSSNTSKTTTAKTDPVTKKECFVAVDEADTAHLKLNYLKSGKVTGNLLIKYLAKGKNDGELQGKFKGDTLFVDYTFKIGTENKTIYKNPLAFLKKDGKLILGVGQIETYLGKSFFAKDKPIDFRQVRFIFAAEDCQ